MKKFDNLETQYNEELIPNFGPIGYTEKINLEKLGFRVMCNPTFEEYCSPVKSYFCSEIIEPQDDKN